MAQETTEDERIVCVRRKVGRNTTDEQVAAARAAQSNDSAIDYAVTMGG